MRVVLLNGPPRCGKDTAGRALAAEIAGASVAKIADPLKSATHEIYGIDAPPDAFEHVKEAPCGAFFGRSPRAAYIEVSEHMIKPALGAAHLGNVMARRLAFMAEGGVRLVAITDSGFAAEAEPIVAAVGASNVLLVRIHADERGCSFAGDSRTHISLPGVATVDLTNDGTAEAFRSAVVALVKDWCWGKVAAA